MAVNMHTEEETFKYVRIHLNQYCEIDYIATTSKHSNGKLLALIP